MPIYTYECQDCGTVQDAFRKLATRTDSPECCGKKTTQIIVPPMIAPVLGGGDFPGYLCPVTDKFVTSRKERREIIKRHDLVERG